MTDGTRDPRDGELEQTATGRWALRFERDLPHPVEQVWQAVTEEAHLSVWFPTTIEGELRAGAALTFRFRGEELPPTSGEMVEYDPPRVIEFTWGFSEEDIDQPEQTRIELTPTATGCRLTLISTYDRVGKSARDAAGWHVCLDLLAADLAGEEPGDHSPERWRPLNRRYKEKFGPEAATIGPPDTMPEFQE
jgi:uncharacterized protein YndB with AHSA1/START domain